MSIPERFYRIARSKFHELRDRIEDMDARALEAEERREVQSSQRRNFRDEALRELNSSAGDEMARKAAPVNAPDLGGVRPAMRTPDEIRQGVPAGSARNASHANQTEYDPLTPHYRLLGLESGADFMAVQAAYHRLLARCDASRFPVGTTEAREAEQIRTRLEETFKVLKDALDPVSRRFDILEIDSPSTPTA
jgi:hypothetical protein